jgi:hypothetical protein
LLQSTSRQEGAQTPCSLQILIDALFSNEGCNLLLRNPRVHTPGEPPGLVDAREARCRWSVLTPEIRVSLVVDPRQQILPHVVDPVVKLLSRDARIPGPGDVEQASSVRCGCEGIKVKIVDHHRGRHADRNTSCFLYDHTTRSRAPSDMSTPCCCTRTPSCTSRRASRASPVRCFTRSMAAASTSPRCIAAVDQPVKRRRPRCYTLTHVSLEELNKLRAATPGRRVRRGRRLSSGASIFSRRRARLTCGAAPWRRSTGRHTSPAGSSCTCWPRLCRPAMSASAVTFS